MRELSEVLSERGAEIEGPPWILGHRGAPLLAPENTLSGLAKALELGLDGVEYDLQASMGAEPVLLHDDTLTRTTDGEGPVEQVGMAELAGLDAGGWFSKAFAGESLPLLEEALALDERADGKPPLHMIELKRADLVERVASALESLPRPLPVRIASFHRAVCLEAREVGLPSMLLALRAEKADLQFVRDERIQAHGLAAFGWRTGSAAGSVWPCERWAWSVDEPDDLLEACRTPLFGFNTNEPLRALGVRALVALAPDDAGPYPIRVPRLPVRPGSFSSGSFEGGGGQWTGDWSFDVRLRNPFAERADLELFFRGRRGAYEIEGGPTELTLEPGAEAAVPLRMAGGSWSPGPEPVLGVRFAFGRGAGARVLVLEAPIVREREATATTHSVRLECLAESPRQPSATLSMRRRGSQLLLAIESQGELEEAQAVAFLDGETFYGAGGLRLALPEDFDHRSGGVPFSCGMVGRRGGERLAWRRWAGALPRDLLSGSPGRLYPAR